MKEITILSGKGGTGKTSFTAALASLATNAVFCDNDVDAADLHLIFDPQPTESHVFKSAYTAQINQDKCLQCGDCQSLCRFDAIHTDSKENYYINLFQCEGYRLCERICEAKAITSEQNDKNVWHVSTSRFGTLVHARLAPGEENSGKLITEIRKRAKDVANTENMLFVINDGPPGIGCSAISSVTGIDLAILVIEPSKSGWHDAERLFQLTDSFKVPVVAIINKHNINPFVAKAIEEELEIRNIPLIGKIPFDKTVVEAMVHGKNIVEFEPASIISKEIKSIWKLIQNRLN